MSTGACNEWFRGSKGERMGMRAGQVRREDRDA